MNDLYARVIELERRNARMSFELQSAQNEMASLENGIRTQAQLPTGGGGSTVVTSNPILKWANDFCFKVDFGTEPTFSSSGSENPTLDAAAFANAVAALATSTRAPARIISTDGSIHVSSDLLFDQTVYWEGGTKPWQLMRAYARCQASLFAGIDSTHLWNIGWGFQCGWFDDPGAEIEFFDAGTDPVSASNRFVPCVIPRYEGDDIGDWYENKGALVDVVGTDLGRIDWTGLVVMDNQGTPTYFPLTAGYRLTKWVSFAYYDSSGGRRGWRYLAYTRDLVDGSGDVLAPYLFADGPKDGTIGAYQFPAYGVRGNITGSGGSGFTSSLGTADVYVSWGTSCDVPVPPITDEEPDDWGDFCASITASSSLWTKIPGLTVKANGTTITSPTLGNYASPPVISFEFSARLQDYLEANPDVSITYSYGVRCDPPPFNPQTGSGTATHGSTVTPPRNTTCAGTKDTQVTLDIKMEASPSRNLFTDECCTPLGLHCSVTVLNADVMEYYIDPL